MENNFIVLLIGASGSGKTTLANGLYRLFGWKPVNSYTTREKRSNDETGHMFVSDKEFDQILLRDGAVAYTEYAGHRYCATQKQVEEAQVYVIDIPGVEYFKSHYRGNKRVITILLNLPEDVRKRRLAGRGDSAAEERLAADRAEFSEIKIASIHPDLVVDKDYSKESLIALVHSFVLEFMGKDGNAKKSDSGVNKIVGKDDESDKIVKVLLSLSEDELMDSLLADLRPLDKAIGLYEEVADLALMYKLKLTIDGQPGSVMLTDETLYVLTKSAPEFVAKVQDTFKTGELREIAFMNMKKRGKIGFSSVVSILGLPAELGSPLFALYSRNGEIKTPALILDKSIEKVILSYPVFEDGFYVIPSSTQEVLVAPKSCIGTADLNEIVRSVNEEVVSPEEQLSDHAYEVVNGELKMVL